jgi:hypothetical protein
MCYPAPSRIISISSTLYTNLIIQYKTVKIEIVRNFGFFEIVSGFFEREEIDFCSLLLLMVFWFSGTKTNRSKKKKKNKEKKNRCRVCVFNWESREWTREKKEKFFDSLTQKCFSFFFLILFSFFLYKIWWRRQKPNDSSRAAREREREPPFYSKCKSSIADWLELTSCANADAPRERKGGEDYCDIGSSSSVRVEGV